MPKVMLSKRLRDILKDRTAREELSKALETSSAPETAQSGTVNFKGKTYRVVVGPKKQVVAPAGQ